MRNLRILLVIMLLATTIDSAAQKYLVYTVTGEVTYQKGKSQIRVAAKDKLDATTVVNVPTNARLTLLDEANSQLCTIKTACSGAIKDVVKANGNSVNKVTSQYVAYLLNKGNADIKKSTKMQSTAASFRDLDSLFFETDSIINEVPIDTLREKGHLVDSGVEQKEDIGKYVSIEDSLTLASYYDNEGDKYRESNYLKDALKFYLRCADIRCRYLGTDSIKTGWALYWSGYTYCLLRDYDNAQVYLKKALVVFEKFQNKDYLTTLSLLDDICYAFQDYASSSEYKNKMADYYLQNDGEDAGNYVSTLFDLSWCYYLANDYQHAYDVGKKVLERTAHVYGTSSVGYGKAANSMVAYCTALNKLNEGITIGKTAYSIFQKIPEAKQLLSSSLNNLASCYTSMGNYAEAIRLQEECLNLTAPENKRDFAIMMSNLAGLYLNMGNIKEAIVLGDSAALIQKALNPKSWEYATALVNLVEYYVADDNYTKALRIGNKAQQIYKEIGQEQTYGYAALLYKLSDIYACLGDNEKAKETAKESTALNKALFGEKHPNYILSLTSLANTYSLTGDNTNAVKAGDELLDIISGNKDLTDFVVVRTLFTLSACFHKAGQSQKAISLLEHAVILCKEDTLSNRYAQLLNNLARCYLSIGDYDRAEAFALRSLQIKKSTMGETNSGYARPLSILADVYYLKGKHHEMQTSVKGFIDNCFYNIRSNFKYLSAKERSQYWRSIATGFTNRIYKYADVATSSIMYSMAYNTAMTSKGLLLDTEIELSNIISESKDSIIINLYNQFLMSKQTLIKQMERLPKDRMLDVDSLASRIREIELELMDKSQAFGDYTRNLNITWEDVQKSLSHDDVAIEFVSFTNDDGDTQYAVLTITAENKSPQMTLLFTDKQFLSVPADSIYDSQMMYSFVWQPLQKRLREKKNIYFAPTGRLHSIGIEYLPIERSRMNEKYNIYRLSSTRELAMRYTKPTYKSIILYGGLKYDSQDTEDISTKIGTDKFYAPDRIITDNIGLHTGVSYLEGTKIEVESIGASFEDKNIKYNIYTEDSGTEASFKRLSGTKVTTLHIATHGFYWTKEKAMKLQKIRFLHGDDENDDIEDKALTRSGLLLAGANNILSHKSIPYNIEDGILTAKEISLLDFRGMDMVVLSACQTGLGEVSDEGVFGLQRGFKKAGAKTIVMSLWKVSDEATLLLMSEFYANMGKGMDKHKAFTEAQKYLRTVNDGEFSAPKYWAAFVMLDAI